MTIDFNVRFTEDQQRDGEIDYNYRREARWTLRAPGREAGGDLSRRSRP